MPPRRGRGKRAPARRQYRGKRTARLSKPMRRAIKLVINKQQERKYTSESYQRNLNAICNSTQNEMFPCVPYTVQAGAGTASSSQRIGQKVTCARMYTDFHVSLNTAISGSKDLVVKLWVLSSKALKNYDDIFRWGTSGNRPLPINFLNDGQGGTQTALGFLYDLDKPVENEEWTSHKEFTFRLSKSTGVLINNQSGFSPTAPVAMVMGGGSTFKRIRVYHKAPKVLNYDANLGNQYPENFAPVWTLSYAYADGSPPVASNTDVYVNVTNHMEFYDA